MLKRRRLSPMADAECYVKLQQDKPGLEAIDVDDYIGNTDSLY